MPNIIKFPAERTKAFKERVGRLRKVTGWWDLSEAEYRRELHRQAMGEVLGEKPRGSK